MFKKLVALNKETHAAKKIKPLNTFDFARKSYLASIVSSEFFRAASTYPIVFIEDPKKDEFRPVVLLGLEPEENLFVSEEGKWEASYIPAIIRRYPFGLAQTVEEDRFTICLDEESEFLNEEEGDALFNEEGEPTEVLERVKKYLGELQAMEQVTTQLCKDLKERNMFTPLNMQISNAGELKKITGGYMINEQRLNNLTDEDFLTLRKSNALPLIYAHLTSLTQVERLLKLRTAKLEATE